MERQKKPHSVNREDLGLGGDCVADVDGRGEFPVLTEKSRAQAWLHGDERVQENRREAVLRTRSLNFVFDTKASSKYSGV